MTGLLALRRYQVASPSSVSIIAFGFESGDYLDYCTVVDCVGFGSGPLDSSGYDRPDLNATFVYTYAPGDNTSVTTESCASGKRC